MQTQKLFANQAIKLKYFNGEFKGVSLDLGYLAEFINQNPLNNSWTSKTGEVHDELVLYTREGKYGPELYVPKPKSEMTSKPVVANEFAVVGDEVDRNEKVAF